MLLLAFVVEYLNDFTTLSLAKKFPFEDEYYKGGYIVTSRNPKYLGLNQETRNSYFFLKNRKNLETFLSLKSEFWSFSNGYNF